MPKVSCLMATHGRASVLSRAVSCFIDQDYEEAELLILNTHPVPIRCDLQNVIVYNELCHATLGHCRNRLLELARGEFVRTWDDDDLYMPWTISQGVECIGSNIAFKPHRSWSWDVGSRTIQLTCNMYEASWLVRTDVARKYGYKSGGGDEHSTLYAGISSEGGLCEKELYGRSSYVYSWNNGLYRISGSLGSGSDKKRTDDWMQHNQDTLSTVRYVDLSSLWSELINMSINSGLAIDWVQDV